MDDILKRLLDAEILAEQKTAQAEIEARTLVDDAATKAQEAEQAFEEQITELHEGFLKQAQQRAQQTLGEVQRRHQERLTQLHEFATKREQSALSAALNLLLHPDEAP
jgi:vacuolar-type H+-ATPase subunit H